MIDETIVWINEVSLLFRLVSQNQEVTPQQELKAAFRDGIGLASSAVSEVAEAGIYKAALHQR